MRRTYSRIFATIAFAGLLLSEAATAPLTAQMRPAQAKGPRPLARHKGLTAGEWLALWWQDQLLTPLLEDGSPPALTGILHRKDVVWVGGPVQPAGSPSVTVPVTIPAGTSLFVPIITVECSVAEPPPFHGENESELRACANRLIDMVSDVNIEIDGRPVMDVAKYRIETPLFRYGPLPENNMPHLPPGTQSDAVAAGYALLLRPLSGGVHRIATRASVPAFEIGVDAEIVVTVEPRGRPRGPAARDR